MTDEQNPGEDHAVAPDSFHKGFSDSELLSVTETISLAFSGDPTWAPILTPVPGDHSLARRYWRLFTESAQRYPWSYTNAEGSTAAIWYPPNADELTAEESDGFPQFVEGIVGAAKAAEVLEISERFEHARPEGEYFYLSLLAVRPDRSGRGLGMQLLAENLREMDALGVPTYLESSNPANDARYERAGYRKHGEIVLPSGLTLSTMWRDPAQR